ncbi:hypothetical protein GC163_12620 [bacterium]|nr:hypothetical protein [bacterium]
MALGLVTCYFNPCGYRNLLKNYWRFRSELDHPIVTVELAFDDRPFEISDAIHIRGGKEHVLWQKERLLNVAIESLPHEIDKVAWIDADFLFLNPNWYRETEEQLDQFAVVQLFEGVIDTGPRCEFVTRDYGWAKTNDEQGKTINIRRPGGAWGMRREVIPHGLYDKAVVGSGDAFQLIAWSGEWNSWLLQQTPTRMRQEFLEWAWPEYQRVRGNIGYVSGDVVHLYHGTRKNRLYAERNRWIDEADYRPSEDVRVDPNGLLAWNSEKSELHQQVADYFGLRQEDE